jgi:hypothetical protein
MEQGGVLAAEGAAEAEDVVAVEADEAVAMSQGLLMTRERRSRDSAKKLTKLQTQTIIAKYSEIRRWREVGSLGKTCSH